MRHRSVATGPMRPQAAPALRLDAALQQMQQMQLG